VTGERVLAANGHAWVELTQRQLQRVCETPAERGFALIDGSHRGFGELLRGPLPPVSEAVAEEYHQADEEFVRNDRQQRLLERTQLQQKTQKRQELDQHRSSGNSLSNIKSDAEMREAVEKELRLGSVVYRALHNHIFAKRSTDPELDMIARVACNQGDVFYGSTSTWTSDTGAVWVQQRHAARPSWLLVEGPGFGVDGPMLIKEATAKNHVQISISFISQIGPFRVYDAFMSVDTKFKKLKEALADATGLNARSIMLVRNLGADGQKNLIQDHTTLQGNGYHGKAKLYFMYMDNFAMDFKPRGQ